MLDDIQTWRARIGLYCARIQCSRGGPKKNAFRTHRSRPSTKSKQPRTTGGLGGSESVLLVLGMLQVAVVLFSLLTVSGDVELNPGPGKGEAGGELAHSAGDKGALTIANLRDVINQLWGVRTQWMEIGLSLGLQLSDLQSIEMSARDDPDLCLTNMLESWLMIEDRVPTWKDVVTALHSVGKVRVASEIEKTQLAESSDMKPDQTDLDEESSEVQEDGRHPVSSERELVHLPIDNWFDVGLKLQLSEKELKKIEGKHSSNEERMRIEMLSLWFQSQPMVTYETLVEALAATENKQTAEEICKKQGIPAELVKASARDLIPVCVRQYASHLKETYLVEPAIQEDPWPPAVSEQYIDLTMVLKGSNDKGGDRGDNIDLQGAFTLPGNEKKPLKVLIDGAPGSGKSTLCRKVVQDWSRNQFLENFNLVVLVPLRDPDISDASSIDDLFYHDDPDIQAGVVTYVKKCQGANILLIFDGYDELSHTQRTKSSLFLQILQGKKLRRCSVAVTSRPHASQKIQTMHSLTRYIEVLGFDEEAIGKCISASFNRKNGRKLYNAFRTRHNLSQLCKTPLNCAIIIYVYKHEGHNLPKTLTEIYDCFICNVLTREADIQGVENRSMLEPDLIKLCHLAYDNCMEDRIVIQEEELRKIVGPTFSPAKLLGLLTATKSYASRGRNTTYQFTHLTIQEFLAAKWIDSQFSPKEAAHFIHQHISNDQLKTLLLFLAGLSKLDHQAYQNVFVSQELDLSSFVYTSDRKRFESLIRLIFESRNSALCPLLSSMVRDKVIILMVSNYFMSANISPSLSYFIDKSCCVWDTIHLKLAHSDFIHFACEYQSTNASTVVKNLFLVHEVLLYDDGCITTNDIGKLLCQHPFRKLECLSVCSPIDEKYYNEIWDVVVVNRAMPIVKLAEGHTLKHLTLHGVIGVGALDLHSIIGHGCHSLVSIDIKSTEVGFEMIVGLISGNSTSLKHMYLQALLPINGNPICRDLENFAASVILENKTLQTLILRDHPCACTVGGMFGSKSFVKYQNLLHAICDNTCLRKVTLGGCDFDLIGLNWMIKRSYTLNVINLVHVPLSDGVLRVIAYSLLNNHTLTKLCLVDSYQKFMGLRANLAAASCIIDHSNTISPLQNLFAAVPSSKLQTLIVDVHPGKLAYKFDSFFEGLLRAIRRSETLTTLTLNYSLFSEQHLQKIAVALVLNGRLREFNLTLGTSLKPSIYSRIPYAPIMSLEPERVVRLDGQIQDQELFIQSKVDILKSEMLEDMVAALSSVLKIRKQKQAKYLLHISFLHFLVALIATYYRRLNRQKSFLNV